MMTFNKLFVKIQLSLSIVLIATIAAACSSSHSDEPKPPTPPEPEPEVTANPRTVIVYMVADNNLGSRDYDQMDIDEMVEAVKAGALDNNAGRLIIFRSRYNQNPSLHEMLADGTVAKLKDYEATTSAVKASTMEQVIADAKEFAPAKEYGIVLWSHASGWIVSTNTPDGNPMQASMKSFGTDSKRQSMNVATLASVLHGQNMRFVYFDCCYMGGVEVAYELRGATDYVVASPTELPNEGMPYHKNVGCFFNKNLEAGLVQAATNTFNDYDVRTDYNRSCTMGVVRTSGLDALANATKAIYTAAAYDVLPADFKPQKYMYESTCYYYDFADYVHFLCPDNALRQAWDASLANTVVYENATPYMWKGYNFDRNLITIKTHCGLSTYILKNTATDAEINGYNTTSWFKDVASALTNTNK